MSLPSVRLPAFASRLLHEQRGLTLIEMLVATVSGVVVMMALFAILDFSISQSGHISEKVDADQQGRIAMEKLTLELHSSCIASQVTPVQPGSDDTAIQFISVPGSQAYTATAELHNVHLAGSAEEPQQLIDSVYKSNGGVSPRWTFPSLSSTPLRSQMLLESASQSQTGSPAKTVPVFQYFRYYLPTDHEAVLGEINPTPMTTPLNEEDAKSTAEVTVSFTANPTSGNTGTDRSASFSDSTLLRFNPTSSTSNNAACA